MKTFEETFISTNEKMPANGQRVLVIFPGGFLYPATYWGAQENAGVFVSDREEVMFVKQPKFWRTH